MRKVVVLLPLVVALIVVWAFAGRGSSRTSGSSVIHLRKGATKMCNIINLDPAGAASFTGPSNGPYTLYPYWEITSVNVAS